MLSKKYVAAAVNDASSKNACHISSAHLQRFGNVVSVGANNKGKIASFFNYGHCVDVYALGENVPVVCIGSSNKVEITSGTSFTVPFISSSYIDNLI